MLLGVLMTAEELVKDIELSRRKDRERSKHKCRKIQRRNAGHVVPTPFRPGVSGRRVCKMHAGPVCNTLPRDWPRSPQRSRPARCEKASDLEQMPPSTNRLLTRKPADRLRRASEAWTLPRTSKTQTTRSGVCEWSTADRRGTTSPPNRRQHGLSPSQKNTISDWKPYLPQNVPNILMQGPPKTPRTNDNSTSCSKWPGILRSPTNRRWPLGL